MHQIESTIKSDEERELFGYQVWIEKGKTILCRNYLFTSKREMPSNKMIEVAKKDLFRGYGETSVLRTFLVNPHQHIGCIKSQREETLKELPDIKEEILLIEHFEFIELASFHGCFSEYKFDNWQGWHWDEKTLIGKAEEIKIKFSTLHPELVLANCFYPSNFDDDGVREGSCASERIGCYRKLTFGFVPKISLLEEINMESLGSLIEKKKKELELLQSLSS
jgi:hypothetical protein